MISSSVHLIFEVAEWIASIFPQGSLAYLLTLAITSGLMLGLIGAAILLLISALFVRIFKLATGREFLFAQTLLSRTSKLTAFIFLIAWLVFLYKGISSGQTFEGNGRSSTRLIYWKDGHVEFIWSFVDYAITLFGFWTLLTTAMFKFSGSAGKNKRLQSESKGEWVD